MEKAGSPPQANRPELPAVQGLKEHLPFPTEPNHPHQVFSGLSPTCSQQPSSIYVVLCSLLSSRLGICLLPPQGDFFPIKRTRETHGLKLSLIQNQENAKTQADPLRPLLEQVSGDKANDQRRQISGRSPGQMPPFKDPSWSKHLNSPVNSQLNPAFPSK